MTSALPTVKVQVDWANPAFIAGSTAGSSFTDISSFVRLDAGITMQGRGRQDAVSDVQPGTASFTVDNSTGRFTANLSTSPYYPNVKLGRRVRIQVKDETGTFTTRFDGFITEIDYTYDSTGNDSTATITCTDVLAYLNGTLTLQSWTRELVALDGPTYTWVLDDDTGSAYAAESSGSNGPPLRLRHFGATSHAATCTFASGNGGIETQANAPSATALGNPSSSPLQSPAFVTQTTDTFGIGQSTSAQLSTAIPAQSTLTGSNFSLEAWVMKDDSSLWSSSQALFCAFALGDTRTGKNVTFGYWNTANAGAGAWTVQTWNYAIQTAPGGSTPLPFNPLPIAETDIVVALPDPGVPIHIVAKVTGNNSGATMTIFINGVSGGSITLPKFFTPDWLDIGGAFGGFCGWEGNISLVSYYGFGLSGTQISNHASMGSNAMAQQLTGASVEQVASYAAIPSFWSNISSATGLGLADYVDITGSSYFSAMQNFEQAEVAGLLYVNAAGQICFDGRQMRMGASAPDLTLPEGSYTADLGYKITTQYLVTRSSVNTPATSRAATVINAGPDQDYGRVASGTPDAPTTVPVLSQSPEYVLRGLPGYETQLDPYVTDVASWQAYRTSTPPFKASSIVVDLLTMADPAESSYVAPSAVYAADINKVIRLSTTTVSLPDDFGALDSFVEGVDEFIDTQSHTVTFYTTPANLARCWKPGDSTWGALDSTAVIGISDKVTHATGPRSKLHTGDPGRPFWPPTYASTMNNGGVSGKGFVGATDQRGIWDTLQLQQQPPIMVAGQSQNTQSFSTGTAGAEQTIQWDSLYIDSAGGMGEAPGSPNFYVVKLAGFYELHAVVVWASNNTGNRFARFLINPNGITNGAAGSLALSVASTSKRPTTSQPGHTEISTRLYLGVGTTVGVRAWQDSGGTITTGVATANGSTFSVMFTGYSTTAD